MPAMWSARFSDRRGAALLVALAALAVAGIVFACLLQGAAVGTRQLRARQRHLQAELLLESGVRRAATRLTQDADFDREEWVLTSEASSLPMPAKITLRAEPVPEQPDRRKVQVSVLYGDEEGQQVERRRSFEFRRASSGGAL